MEVPLEKTFRSYNAAQGKQYAASRMDYHPSVYEYVVNQHTATGGQFNTLVDVGCGPGNAVRFLAPQFQRAFGVDPSPGMVEAARELGGASATGPIQYSQSLGEDLCKDPAGNFVLGNESVDLITLANAAHWLDMAPFWQRAAKVLRPGGSVAIWTSGEMRIHPSTVASEEVQAIFDRFDVEEFGPYLTKGNLLVRGKYTDLVMPWTAPTPIDAFPEAQFIRRNWDVGERFMKNDDAEITMDMVEKIMSTASPYTRWCEAHPDDVNSERNILHKIRREVEKVQQEAGVEKGKEFVRGMVLGAVLIVKKKAA